MKSNFEITDTINELPFNHKKQTEIFKFIIKNKIRHNRQHNKIFFDINILTEKQLEILNNILIN